MGRLLLLVVVVMLGTRGAPPVWRAEAVFADRSALQTALFGCVGVCNDVGGSGDETYCNNNGPWTSGTGAGTPTRENSSRRERERRERRGERGIDGREDTTTTTRRGRRRRRDRTDDSLLTMAGTLPTFHEDRSWLKAKAELNTRRRRGRRRPV